MVPDVREMMKKATNRRLDGLVFLLFGAFLYLTIGFAWSRVSPIDSGDFKVVYYASRCLLQHGDPYSQEDVLRVYRVEGRENPTESQLDRDVKTRFFYPPTAFIVTLPIAATGFVFAKVIWTVLCACTFILAALSIWEIASDSAPRLAGALAGLLLANSFWLMMIGNSAAIAVGLCVIATWCFYRNRFAWLGVLAMALSLALKPNDSGLVWLFLLLAAPILRKRALQALASLALLSAPFLVWVARVSPHWLQQLQTNMASFSATGGIVDSGLAGMAGKNMDNIVQLQTATSVFFSAPRTSTLITYLICAPLLLLWARQTLRQRPAGSAIWLPLAVAAPLTVLPTYHFQHDAKLLLFAIPACAMLWAKRDRVGKIALLLTTGAILVNGDIFTAVRILLTRSILIPEPNFLSRLATLLFTRPAPLVLLAMSIFYLWTYLRHQEPA
jgi:hypothetical protein